MRARSRIDARICATWWDEDHASWTGTISAGIVDRHNRIVDNRIVDRHNFVASRTGTNSRETSRTGTFLSVRC